MASKKHTLVMLMHLFPMSKSEAFEMMSAELDVNPGFFNDGGQWSSTRIASDYLRETHGISNDDAAEWAQEWAMLPEQQQYFGFSQD